MNPCKRVRAGLYRTPDERFEIRRNRNMLARQWEWRVTGFNAHGQAKGAPTVFYSLRKAQDFVVLCQLEASGYPEG